MCFYSARKFLGLGLLEKGHASTRHYRPESGTRGLIQALEA
jgi:hypothetical protein